MREGKRSYKQSEFFCLLVDLSPSLYLCVNFWITSPDRCIIVSTSLCSRAMVLNQECVRIAWEAFSGTCLGFRWSCVSAQQTSGGARECVCFESCLGDSDTQPQDELCSRSIIGSKYAPACSKMPIFLT